MFSSRISRNLVLTAMFMGISPMVVQAADDALIRIKSSAHVKGPLIQLADIAIVYHRNPQRQHQLNRILLGPAPSSGSEVRITHSQLRRQLRDRGLDLSRIRFSGANETLVRSNQVVPQVQRSQKYQTGRASRYQESIATKAVSRAIQHYLNRAVPNFGAISVRVQIPEAGIATIASAANRGFQVRGGRPPWNKVQTFQINFLDRNERVRSILVRALIEKQPYVLVARHLIPKGALIRPTDLAWQQIQQVQRDSITRLEDAVGREAKQSIQKGHVLSSQWLRKVPAVRSNNIVTVYSRRGGITIQRQMRARGNAAIGESVTLVPLKGGSRIVAQVTGLNQAEVRDSRGTPSNTYRDNTGVIQFLKSNPTPRKKIAASQTHSPVRQAGFETSRRPHTSRFPGFQGGK
ncbi:MAG: hypothetical protein Tsb009_25960 [Planctomycetaceae bacterium]